MSPRRSCLAVVALVVAPVAAPRVLRADEGLCPEARFLPQLTIDRVQDPAVPVIDPWQVFWGNVPLSDYQLAALAGHDRLIDRTRQEMEMRPTWVYVGVLLAAAGTAISSYGWVLFGNGKQSQALTLSMGLGGIVLGGAGLLTITDSVQRPLEPLLAPTPEHRLTREEVRQLVALVNRRLYREICEAANASRGKHPEADVGSRTKRAGPTSE